MCLSPDHPRSAWEQLGALHRGGPGMGGMEKGCPALREASSSAIAFSGSRVGRSHPSVGSAEGAAPRVASTMQFEPRSPKPQGPAQPSNISQGTGRARSN